MSDVTRPRFVVIIYGDLPSINIHECATLADARAVQKKEGGGVYEILPAKTK